MMMMIMIMIGGDIGEREIDAGGGGGVSYGGVPFGFNVEHGLERGYYY